MGFFDKTVFPGNDSQRKRYNERYKRIIEPHSNYISGKNLLDLGSHNGVWSWAALENGAQYVFGIEGRQKLINAHTKAFSKFKPNQYSFICSDIFDGLSSLSSYNQPKFDVILCLGIFYHIMDHYRLMRLMTNLKPDAIILDTGLINLDEPMIKLVFEETGKIANAIPENESQNQTIVGFCSVGALKSMAKSCGYSASNIEWRRDDVDDLDGIEDYFNTGTGKAKRYTFLLTPIVK